MDFTRARYEMVAAQIESRGISNKRLLDVMRKIPREKFVSQNQRISAYEDHPIPIGEEQTISQPYIVALMTELLELKGEERVLEIGTGSGYQTAILADLSKEVYSIERHENLLTKAGRVLTELGYRNVHLFVDDGSMGLKEFAPYDRIIVTAAAPEIPSSLTEQLSDSGIMVIPIGSVYSQDLNVVTKKSGEISIAKKGGCVFVPLVGKYGWQENEK